MATPHAKPGTLNAAGNGRPACIDGGDETGCDYLFVYGTLRRAADGAMHRFLAGHAEWIGSATYAGRLYRLDGYPGAVPAARTGETVRGEVYRLWGADSILQRLDEYEECGAAFPEPTEYVRRLQPVRLDAGDVVTAWVYLFNRDTEGLEPIRSGDFFQHRAE